MLSTINSNIIALKKIHYATDQQALIDHIVSLSDNYNPELISAEDLADTFNHLLILKNEVPNILNAVGNLGKLNVEKSIH